MKTADLTGPALDYWVARAEGYDSDWLRRQMGNPHPVTRAIPRFSTEWVHGGPIIDRGRIILDFMGAGHGWQAAVNPHAVVDTSLAWADGETPLIAAMRAYVVSKLGEEVPDA